MTKSFSAQIKTKNDVMVVQLQGSLEVDFQGMLKEKIEEISGKESDIVLDFSEVTFIDSSCLGALVSSVKSLRAKKGDLKLSCLQEEVRSIFQITRLDKIFEIFENVEEAIESYYK